MDAIAPTKERIRQHAGAVDTPSRDQRTNRTAYRLISPVETLRRQSRITEEQWQAFQRFSMDLERGSREPPSIGAYGERIGGTSDDDYCPTTHKLMSYGRAKQALEAVGEPTTCGILVHAAQREATLASIARDVLGINRNQGAGAVTAYLDSGTYRLWQWYRQIGCM
jgi:hypothetical protein